MSASTASVAARLACKQEMTAVLIGSEGLGEFGLLALGLLVELEHLITE